MDKCGFLLWTAWVLLWSVVEPFVDRVERVGEDGLRFGVWETSTPRDRVVLGANADL